MGLHQQAHDSAFDAVPEANRPAPHLLVLPGSHPDVLGHPYVEDVAVGAVPDDYTGQRPKAYVVLKREVIPNRNKTQILSLLDEIIDYVCKNKVRHKWIIAAEMLDEIPKSASGKILRRMLRNLENDTKLEERIVSDRKKISSRL